MHHLQVIHAALKATERIDRGDVVLICADSGWKYVGTNLCTGAPESEAGEELDDTIWW